LYVLSKHHKAFKRKTQTLSDVYRIYIQLPTIMAMSIGELGVITGILKNRFQFVYGDAHGVAHLLEPRYGGEHMDHATREAAQDFIGEWHGSDQEDYVFVEILKFQAEHQRPSRELKLVNAK
jgi:hypothetical protein